MEPVMPSKNWELLANFESFELVTREYTARHGRKPNIRHAREIAAPFSHARSYFRSAHSAEPTVKPLLLYYGVVSLARGVTLMLSRGMREANLALSHGLSAKKWGGVLSGDKPDFSALRIEVNATGTFVELGKATEKAYPVVPGFTGIGRRAREKLRCRPWRGRDHL